MGMNLINWPKARDLQIAIVKHERMRRCAERFPPFEGTLRIDGDEITLSPETVNRLLSDHYDELMATAKKLDVEVSE